MVVTNILLAVLLIAILADVWHRQATLAHHEQGWLDGLADRFREQEDRFLSALRQGLKAVRTDVTDLWAQQQESEARILSEVRLRAEETSSSLEEFARVRHDQALQRMDRLQEGAAEAAATAHEAIDRQLADLMREVSDPTLLRLMRAIAVAFQVEGLLIVNDAGAVESPDASSVGGPMAPNPVPNAPRQLEAARFSEETITNGMQELMEGAAARGITLSLADARHQAMLMLNGEGID